MKKKEPKKAPRGPRPAGHLPGTGASGLDPDDLTSDLAPAPSRPERKEPKIRRRCRECRIDPGTNQICPRCQVPIHQKCLEKHLVKCFKALPPQCGFKASDLGPPRETTPSHAIGREISSRTEAGRCCVHVPAKKKASKKKEEKR